LENDSTSDNKSDSSTDRNDGISGENSGKISKKAANEDGSLTVSFTIDLEKDTNNARHKKNTDAMTRTDYTLTGVLAGVHYRDVVSVRDDDDHQTISEVRKQFGISVELHVAIQGRPREYPGFCAI